MEDCYILGSFQNINLAIELADGSVNPFNVAGLFLYPHENIRKSLVF